MNVRHVADTLLIAYVLDEMGEEERAMAAAHVETCAACSEMVQRMGAALRAYREAPLPAAPARVLAELLAAQATRRGRDARRREAARRPGWRWVAAAAALTVVTFGAGFWVGHRSGEAPEAAEHGVVSAPAPGVRLPEAPSIAFQAAPPMDAWMVSPAAVTVGTTPRDGVADSL